MRLSTFLYPLAMRFVVWIRESIPSDNPLFMDLSYQRKMPSLRDSRPLSRGPQEVNCDMMSLNVLST